MSDRHALHAEAAELSGAARSIGAMLGARAFEHELAEHRSWGTPLSSIRAELASRCGFDTAWDSHAHAPPAKATTSDQTVEKQFADHLRQWKKATAGMSIAARMTAHPAYVAIIEMGRPALPFILREMETSLDHWAPALRAISGENPVRPSDAGDMAKIARRWVAWGKAKRII